MRIHRKTIATKQIHLVPDIPEEVTGEVRAGEILQVISNLIANALDALPEGGTLSFASPERLIGCPHPRRRQRLRDNK